MFKIFSRPCPSCEVMRDLLRESEKRNKELVVLLKNNLDAVHEHNTSLTDSITGKAHPYQARVPVPVPRPTSRRGALRELEKRDRGQALANQKQAIEDLEEQAGLKVVNDE